MKSNILPNVSAVPMTARLADLRSDGSILRMLSEPKHLPIGARLTRRAIARRFGWSASAARAILLAELGREGDWTQI